MSTLSVLAAKREVGDIEVPVATAWYLADLGEALGRQQLYTQQAPQRLKLLRDSAIVESAVASNRIEGVEVAADRVNPLLLGRARARDRDEAEVRGYRDALRWLHEDASKIAVDEDTVRRLHRLARAAIGDAGSFRARDLDIIERRADGQTRVRFSAVAGARVRPALAGLLQDWSRGLAERWVPTLVAIAAFNLDCLCVHPFRDGNGRVSRLLLLLQLYQAGYEVGRYVSLERLIEENKDRYYETLEHASRGWHDGRHDPWPYVNFLLHVVKDAYAEFEQRVGLTREPRGAKTETVMAAVRRASGSFTVAQLQRSCPGVSVDLIRHVLDQMRAKGRIACLGRGRKAAWAWRDDQFPGIG